MRSASVGGTTCWSVVIWHVVTERLLLGIISFNYFLENSFLS